MNGRLLLFLFVSGALFLTGCNPQKTGMDIRQVVYTSDSGTVQPEFQWHEETGITRDKITLLRNGKIQENEINEGAWDFTAEEKEVEMLFEQLAAVNCAEMKRIEGQEAPEGGGSESFIIIYADGKECVLFYDAGTTYQDGEFVVKPVLLFVQSLTLPEDAAGRYR